MRRLLTALVCLSAAVGSSPMLGQQAAQQPTFRSGISLVTIDVTVLDEDGKPVQGLTASDVEIKLNGKVQPIRAFAFVQAAARSETAAESVRAAAPAPPPAAVAADAITRRTMDNATPTVVGETAGVPATPAAPAESRVFVLVVDDLSFSPLRGKVMFSAAQRFLDRVPASDPIGFTTTTGIGAVNPTVDRAAVRAALAKVMGQFDDPRGLRKSGPAGAAKFGTSDSPLGISESLDIDRGDETLLKEVIARECFNGDRSVFNGVSLAEMLRENQCASDVQREARQVASLTRQNKGRQIEGVKSVIQAMKTASGIRHVVLLSDGLPVSREVDDLNALVRAAAEASVQLSVLMEDPDFSLTDDARGELRADQRPQTDPGQSRRRREDNLLLVTGLQTMTDMLGGSFYRVVGTPDPFFDRMIVASSAVYRLGVELPAGSRPGDVFNVSASVKRPGLKARANRFTVAVAPPSPEPTSAPEKPAPEKVPPRAALSVDDALTAALNSKTSAHDVPIRIAAFVRRSASREGHVDVSVDAAIPGSVKGPITTYVGVVDAAGALRSSRRVLDAPGPSGYAASFLFPLSPGDYRLRYAAADAAGAIGTIELPIRAALASIGPFTASDLLTWYVDEANKAQLFAIEDIPAGVDTLRASIELYPSDASVKDVPVVRWTLSREGEPNPVQTEEVAAQAGQGMFRSDAQFALQTLPRGRYVIRAALLVGGEIVGSKAAVVRR